MYRITSTSGRLLAIAPLLLAPLAPLAEAGSQDLTPAQEARLAEIEWHVGSFDIGDGVAHCELPEEWSMAVGPDARFLVESVMGNPEDTTVIGLATRPESEEGWVVVISFVEMGYVDDDDAADLDPDELLESMRASDAERGVIYNGWAVQPDYDAQRHALTWAVNLRFPDIDGDTLNYDTRLLGRRGVLSLNAVGDISDLTSVRRTLPELARSITYNPGHRYDDHVSGDKVAALGIGGLIAGKVLLKSGLLLKLLKPLLVVGALAVGFLGKLLGKKQKPEPRRRRRAVAAGPEGELDDLEELDDDDDRT